MLDFDHRYVHVADDSSPGQDRWRCSAPCSSPLVSIALCRRAPGAVARSVRG